MHLVSFPHCSRSTGTAGWARGPGPGQRRPGPAPPARLPPSPAANHPRETKPKDRGRPGAVPAPGGFRSNSCPPARFTCVRGGPGPQPRRRPGADGETPTSRPPLHLPRGAPSRRLHFGQRGPVPARPAPCLRRGRPQRGPLPPRGRRRPPCPGPRPRPLLRPPARPQVRPVPGRRCRGPPASSRPGETPVVPASTRRRRQVREAGAARPRPAARPGGCGGAQSRLSPEARCAPAPYPRGPRGFPPPVREGESSWGFPGAEVSEKLAAGRGFGGGGARRDPRGALLEICLDICVYIEVYVKPSTPCASRYNNLLCCPLGERCPI